MSDLGLIPEPSRRKPGHRSNKRRRERERRGGFSCLLVLVVGGVLLVGAYFGITRGVAAINEFLGGPEDYSGAGTGSVVVEVHPGDSVAAMGRTMKAEDVVASVDAFLSAAGAAGGEVTQVQPGFYDMRKQMSAEAAVQRLLDPASRVDSTVTVPEGARVDQVVTAIAEGTDFNRKQVEAALQNPKLGLPEAANGDPQGYLFPATYTIAPDSTALSLLQQMVAAGDEVRSDLQLGQGAQALGYTPAEIVTVASIIQAEAGPADMRKVARVIYNRLDAGMPLQMDSTVHFAVGKDGSVWTSDVDRESDSPYNTYRFAGLPPGPIDNPGEEALSAALDPADGDWLYFTVIDPKTGESAFTSSYDEHLANVDEFKAKCEDQGGC